MFETVRMPAGELGLASLNPAMPFRKGQTTLYCTSERQRLPSYSTQLIGPKDTVIVSTLEVSNEDIYLLHVES